MIAKLRDRVNDRINRIRVDAKDEPKLRRDDEQRSRVGEPREHRLGHEILNHKTHLWKTD